jgi:hypothetical protein
LHVEVKGGNAIVDRRAKVTLQQIGDKPDVLHRPWLVEAELLPNDLQIGLFRPRLGHEHSGITRNADQAKDGDAQQHEGDQGVKDAPEGISLPRLSFLHTGALEDAAAPMVISYLRFQLNIFIGAGIGKQRNFSES